MSGCLRSCWPMHESARRGSGDRWSTQKESSPRLGARNSGVASRERKLFAQFGSYLEKFQAYTSTNKENTVKKFVLLHYGFERPTPEIMAAWGKWFESMKDNIIDVGGNFSRGQEISKAGTKDLPRGPESITGFTIVSADSLDDALKMAHSSPHSSHITV